VGSGLSGWVVWGGGIGWGVRGCVGWGGGGVVWLGGVGDVGGELGGGRRAVRMAGGRFQ